MILDNDKYIYSEQIHFLVNSLVGGIFINRGFFLLISLIEDEPVFLAFPPSVVEDWQDRQ